MPNIFTKIFQRTKAPISNRYGAFSAGGSIPPDYNSIDALNDYSSVGWLQAVVYRIALGCSEVNWYLDDVTNRDKPKRIDDHDILTLLRSINPFQTKEEFVALHFIYKALIGKSFWLLNFNALGEPAEIVLPYPQKMWIVPDKAFPFIKGYIYGDSPNSADAIPISANEVIYDKEPSPLNQYSGLGQAQTIGVNLQAEKYAGKWNRNFFYNAARPDGVIESPHSLSDEQFDKLKKQWSENYKGVDKAHQIALLEDGLTYKQIQNSVKDMDFSTLSLRNRDVILGVFGMPQSAMGISENVNKANAIAGEYQFTRWLIKPRLNWMCSKLNEQLLPKFKGAKNLRLKFDEVVPETIEEKMLLAESGMRAGYLTINEARKLRGLDPLENGDVLLVPLNLIPMRSEDLAGYKPPVDSNPNGELNEEPVEEEPVDENKNVKGYTKDQKREIWNRYILKTSNQETMFKRVFNVVFKEQQNDVVKFYTDRGQLPDSLDDEKTASRFKPAIETIYLSGYEDAIPKQFGLLDEHALEWISTRSLLLAKSINKTTLDALRNILREGMESGESIQTLTKRIEEYFPANEKYRAEMVARSEVITANAQGANERFKNEGIKEVQWMSAPDSCLECTELDGQIFPIDEGARPALHPNCRCTILAVLD